MATDLYQSITDRIVSMLESGVAPWQRPWNATGAPLSVPLRHNGEPYRGVNVLMLWATALTKGYNNNHWLTYKQAQAYGACVRKGEKGTMVVYASAVIKDAGTEDERSIPFLKAYYVFNADQIDGLGERYATPAPITNDIHRIDVLESFFNSCGVNYSHGGNRAFYSPSIDAVRMPDFTSFHHSDNYYSTLAHEFIHWTGHKSRLDRKFGGSFGNPEYAAEELVAELGAAFICGLLGVNSEPREDHASYIASWLSALKADKRAIFTAASKAQQAADYLQAQATAARLAA